MRGLVWLVGWLVIKTSAKINTTKPLRTVEEGEGGGVREFGGR